MKQIKSDATSVTINESVFPKNVLCLYQTGNLFTIRAIGGDLVVDKVIYSDFVDATNAPYATPAAFVTAFKTAAYAA